MFASKLVESKRWSKLPFGTVGKIQLQDVMEETHTICRLAIIQHTLQHFWHSFAGKSWQL